MSENTKPYIDVQYYQVMEIGRILTHFGFFKHGIELIKDTPDDPIKLAEVYDRLYEEDLAGEPYSEMSHLYRNNPPKDEAIGDLRERMKQYIQDIKGYLDVEEDSQIIPALQLLQQKQLEGVKLILEEF